MVVDTKKREGVSKVVKKRDILMKTEKQNILETNRQTKYSTEGWLKRALSL